MSSSGRRGRIASSGSRTARRGARRHIDRSRVVSHGVCASRNLHFPLLADFHPKGEVAQAYGVYDDEIGMSERALYVIDEEGVIRWSYVSPIGVNPGAEGILTALESMAAEPVPA
jgi:peroxiredoxin